MASYMGQRGIKLLISIHHAVKRLKIMSRGQNISRIIMRFRLESAFRGEKYSSKLFVMCLRWLLAEFPASDSF